MTKAYTKSYNLKERILAFVLRVIALVKALPDNRINRILIDQIVRSATSIGSNYEEADGTGTRRDFTYKMGLVKKECKETKYWIILIQKENSEKYNEETMLLLAEGEELTRIFASIIIKSSASVGH